MTIPRGPARAARQAQGSRCRTAVASPITYTTRNEMRIQELKERAAAAWALLVGKDGNLVAHAKQELSAIGYYDGDEMNAAMA